MVQMLHLTHISCLSEQVKVFGAGPFPPYYKSNTNQTRMDDASEYANTMHGTDAVFDPFSR